MSNRLGIEWYEESCAEFIITTAEQLYDIARLSDFYTFENQTIKLGADIQVNEGEARDWKLAPPEKKWIPISGFAGTFDGQGHSISGIYGKSAFTKIAMFTNTRSTCQIQNIRLLNSYFENHGHEGTASFVAGGSGTWKRLYSDAILYCNGELCGGIASKLATDAKILDCWFAGTILQTGRRMGGIVAEVTGGNICVEHIVFSGDICTEDSIASQNDGVYVGGIFGWVGKDCTISVSDSLIFGSVRAPKNPKYCASSIGRVFDGAKVTINHVCDTVPDDALSIVGRGTVEGQITKVIRKERMSV